MRCRFGRYALAMVSAVLLSSAAIAALPKVTPDDIAEFRQEWGGFSFDYDHAPLLRRWQAEAKAALQKGSMADAAAALAPEYGLTPPQMRRLIETAVLARKLAYLRGDTASRQRDELRASVIAQVHESDHNPLLIETAALVLGGYDVCKPDGLTAVTDGAPDPIATGWMAVENSGCPAWQQAFLKMAGPRNVAPLLAIVGYTGLMERREYLALYGYLTSQVALAHVDPADRTAAHAYLAYDYTNLMWTLGLFEEGIAYVDKLPPEVRTLLLDGDLKARDIHVDGLVVRLSGKAMSGFSPQDMQGYRAETSSDHFRVTLASAYFLTGRTADAERVFAGTKMMPSVTEWFSCHLATVPDRRAEPRCPYFDNIVPAYMYLDFLLHHPADDPYLMAEALLRNDGALDSELSCRVFVAPQFGVDCTRERRGLVDLIRFAEPPDERSRGAVAAIRSVPGVEAWRQSAAASLDAAVARFGGKGYQEERAARPSIDPLPSPFAQLPLPEQYRGKPAEADHSWLKHLAKLPQGFEPVRIERDGARVVAITVSQNYDPTGEVSPGGFWVHVSDDGGKSWQAPFYTGLSFAFPYVVLQQSKLPLIDGDTLNVAVDIQLLDTASIMYPPMALQSRRHETNLYLKVPLADLRRDSDGDGITDIAEAHLLLDPHNPDSDGDGLPDGVDPMPNVKHAAVSTQEQQAVQLLLEKLFSIRTGAIIQKIDHGDGEDAIQSAITSVTKNDPNSVTRPIFVEGDKSDFAGLIPSRMMLVYSPADIAKLQRMTPDFHAVSFGKIVFNRAHTRGFFSYSFGWSGGTVRLLWQNGHWKMEEISSWIT